MIQTDTYQVTLTPHSHNPNGRKYPKQITEEEITADSPMHAAYQVMRHYDLVSVKCAYVTYADGCTTWQRSPLVQENTYQVILIPARRVNGPSLSATIEATSPILAVLALMKQHHLDYVESAGARYPDGALWFKLHMYSEEGTAL